jgi:streptogramin lyase
MKLLARLSLTVVSSVTLVASGLTGSVAHAASQEVVDFPLAAGATPRGIAVGSDNNIWVTGGTSNTISRVSTSGAATNFALTAQLANGNPWGIAAGPDGNLWFTAPDIGFIGQITPQGVIRPIPLPEPGLRPRDIAAGSDQNMWFTEQGGRIGRVTMSGEVTLYSVPWPNAEPRSITPGPVGSNRLYFTDPGADRVAEVYTSGQIESVAQLATDSNPAGIAVVNNGIWFSMSSINKIGQLVAVNTILELSVPGGPTEIAAGPGDTMWISLPGQNAVAKYTSGGVPTATYQLPSPNALPGPLVAGPGGNIWVTERNVGRVARVVSGQVPVATAAPSVTPTTGINPGSVLTATNGTWNFSAASYTYKWQRCTNASDANTCQDISGATSQSYTVTGDDASRFIRVGVQGVNASGAGAVSFSSVIGVGTPTPAPGPAPGPVAGGQTATIAQGVTLTLRATNRTRAGVRRPFAVIANTANIRGKLRITIVDSAGRERQVIAKGRVLRPFGTDNRRALRRNVVSRSLSPGTYTVRAVFTPAPRFRDRFPVATMTKPITIRR